MAQQNITIGAQDAGTGDTYFDAFTKVEANFTDLYSNFFSAQQIDVYELSDLPAAAGGIITLAADTNYFIKNSINFGTDRIVMSSRSSIDGAGRLAIVLTYTGTGDFITLTNASGGKIEGITIICSTGRFFNFSDNGDNLLVIEDVTVTCDKVGIFNSTGANGSVMRVSNATITATTSGMTFTGAWNRTLFLTIGFNLSAGSVFDLGVATFKSFYTDLIGMGLSAGATFLTGAAGSANITASGVGVIRSTRDDGVGTMLSGITPDDDRWDFYINNRIRDTRSDGLLSMQANATNTVITTQSVYVKVAGTWTVQPGAKFTGTTGGRLTYIGLKGVRHPIDISLSVEPVSGTNKTISVRVAKNGATIADSKRTIRTDSGSPINISCPWQLTLTTNDYIEVFIANDTGTTDLLVTNATLRIN
jgi:hypothetical protein